jgi:hypothetical protein
MLYCTIRDPNFAITAGVTEFQWHVGEPPPWLKEDWFWRLRTHVVDIQADGDELQAVYRQFRNLPEAPYNRVVTWTGDFARFIALNLAPWYKS